MSIVHALHQLCGGASVNLAQLVIQKLQLHDNKDHDGDDERMPTWNNHHCDVHDAVLNRKAQPEVIFRVEWKPAGQNQTSSIVGFERLNDCVGAHQVAGYQSDDPKARSQIPFMSDARRYHARRHRTVQAHHLVQSIVDQLHHVHISHSIPVEINHPEGCCDEKQGR